MYYYAISHDVIGTPSLHSSPKNVKLCPSPVGSQDTSCLAIKLQTPNTAQIWSIQ